MKDGQSSQSLPYWRQLASHPSPPGVSGESQVLAHKVSLVFRGYTLRVPSICMLSSKSVAAIPFCCSDLLPDNLW